MNLVTTATAPEGMQPSASEQSLAAVHERIHRLIDVLLADRDNAPPEAITLALEALEYVHCLDSDLTDLLDEHDVMRANEAKAAE